jgi:hypothetical protein
VRARLSQTTGLWCSPWGLSHSHRTSGNRKVLPLISFPTSVVTQRCNDSISLRWKRIFLVHISDMIGLSYRLNVLVIWSPLNTLKLSWCSRKELETLWIGLRIRAHLFTEYFFLVNVVFYWASNIFCDTNNSMACKSVVSQSWNNSINVLWKAMFLVRSKHDYSLLSTF